MDLSAGFQLLAGHLALDFANTLDDRYVETGPLELLSSFDRLIAFCEQSGMIASRQARRLLQRTGDREADQTLPAGIELREALYGLFRNAAREETPRKADLEILNRFLEEAHSGRVVCWKDGVYQWESRDTVAGPRELLSRIAAAAADLLTSSDRLNVRECGAEPCRWLFLDHSKNHSRRWCDMKICGNRAKARSFQDRRKASTGPRP